MDRFLQRVPVRRLMQAGWCRAVRITKIGGLASESVLDCLLYHRLLLECSPERPMGTDDQNVLYFVLLSLSFVNFCFLFCLFCVSVSHATQEMCGSSALMVEQVT